MTGAFFRLFQVRPGEERMSVLLVLLLLAGAAGSAIGGNATEALFFARFGVSQLPAMYILLGLITFAASMAITVLMGRVNRQRLYVVLPLVIGLLLIIERLVILLNFRWFFAFMWLAMNVINSLLGLVAWGLAGLVCDTRQAKRLFPLFSAGGIAGTVLGGLVTPPLAGWLHSENLLLVWAAALFLSFAAAEALARSAPVSTSPSESGAPGVVEEMQRGYQFVRRSAIMRWVSYSSVLFSVCFFSLALPFSRGAAAQFADADRLAGFLGLFQSLSTGAALLASLFLANRLFTRFGLLPVLLVFPIIYFAGFGILAIFSPFALLVAVRFAQMAYMNGIAETAWQALFNVVPPEQRDQVRAFVGGVPSQAGTFIAGLVLLLGEQALAPQQLYLVGFAAAALLVYLVWRASRAYGQALVDALRAGQPHVFFNEEQPFGGPRISADAMNVALQGLSDSDAAIRRISAEIAGHFQTPQAVSALVSSLADGDPAVRTAALTSLGQVGSDSIMPEVSAALSDPEAEVRMQAVDTLSRLAPSVDEVTAQIEPLLQDEDPFVRIHCAQVLLKTPSRSQALRQLLGMSAAESTAVRARAITALGECGDEMVFEIALRALDDSQGTVRKAACQALVKLNGPEAVPHLIDHLNDDDTSVRRALADALGSAGEMALEPLVGALSSPSYEDGALMALEHLPVEKVQETLRAHARGNAQEALKYHHLAEGIRAKLDPTGGLDGKADLLMESLQDKARHSGLNALRTLGLVTSRETISVAVENLRSRYPAQRANALETLEAAGEREIIRPLLVLWESGESSTPALPENWLQDLLADPYSWIRACAVLLAGQMIESARSGNGKLDLLRGKLLMISRADPDPTVRDAARTVLKEGETMETLNTLSLMERVLFLKRVPLFAELPPVDLKQIAAVASEVLFADGQLIARQDAPGMEMYILVSGEVQVLMAAGEKKEQREVAIRRAGDYVGEMAVISQEPRMATLIAKGPVRALCLEQKQFEGIVRERPEISLALLRTLSHRLKEASGMAAGQ